MQLARLERGGRTDVAERLRGPHGDAELLAELTAQTGERQFAGLRLAPGRKKTCGAARLLTSSRPRGSSTAAATTRSEACSPQARLRYPGLAVIAQIATP